MLNDQELEALTTQVIRLKQRQLETLRIVREACPFSDSLRWEISREETRLANEIYELEP